MNYTQQEVLEFITENDVKFIRLAFCDIFGSQKNIAIMADELPRAFETGISFDASAVEGFLRIEESDLLLFPDPSTISILPWRPQQGSDVRFFCDIKRPDGSYFEGDGRYLLKRAVEKARNLGYQCKIGAECEFYLFETDEQGNPTKRAFDQAGYLDIAPLDKGENVRREICLTLEGMGIKPESSHHEQGPGQNEVDFQYSDALSAADHMVTFQSVVNTVAAQNGLYADFSPKPFSDKSGNGFHINMSLFQGGRNIFRVAGDGHCSQAESFIQGILERIEDMTVFLNPLPESYCRLGTFEAPKYITWSHQNRSQLIRIPIGRDDRARLEVRSADTSCNPYYAYALLIFAGIEGIERQLHLCPPVDRNLLENISDHDLPKALPESLQMAVACAKKSTFLKRYIPENVLESFLESRKHLC